MGFVKEKAMKALIVLLKTRFKELHTASTGLPFHFTSFFKRGLSVAGMSYFTLSAMIPFSLLF